MVQREMNIRGQAQTRLSQGRWSGHLTGEYQILTEPDMGPDCLFLGGWAEFRRKICRMKNILFEIRCFSAFPGKIRQIPGIKWACLVLFGWLIAGLTGQYSCLQKETPFLEVSIRDDPAYPLVIRKKSGDFIRNFRKASTYLWRSTPNFIRGNGQCIAASGFIHLSSKIPASGNLEGPTVFQERGNWAPQLPGSPCSYYRHALLRE